MNLNKLSKKLKISKNNSNYRKQGRKIEMYTLEKLTKCNKNPYIYNRGS